MEMNPTIHPREKRTYANPIPDRDFILGLFGPSKKHLLRDQIASELRLSDAEQREALRRRLRAMERDGQVLFDPRKGYQRVEQDMLVTGKISLHADGFGFVSPGDNEKDLFLPANQLEFVFDGDAVEVLVSPSGDHKRTQSRLIRVVKRHTTQIAGLLTRRKGNYLLTPDNSKMPRNIEVDASDLRGAKAGEYVITNIVQYPSRGQATRVAVADVLGHPSSPGMETRLALHRFGIDPAFGRDVLASAEAFGDEVRDEDKAERLDYRAFPFVTIDGEDAKDFDDAVYCERTEEGNWRLLVAIADVSHYVKPGDILDAEAQSRATSIYCPGQVIPMLPEALSNGLCSLNPGVDRLVLVCNMLINPSGHLIRSLFTEGVIHSHARLTYEQANALVTRPDSAKAKQVARTSPDIVPHVNDLHTLYHALKKARGIRGAIDFETRELKLALNRKRQIARIDPVIRNDAHRMIEEFMLCANVATAQFLAHHKIPGLYRVHAGPQKRKLDGVRAQLMERGLQLAGGDKPTPQHYNRLLADTRHREDAEAIQTWLLRTQSQAEYSASNGGHFGLGYDAYAHFTSPIRRYPDLITHRAIRAKLRENRARGWQKAVDMVGLSSLARRARFKKMYPYNAGAIEKLGTHCSERSRQADEVSREVERALKCQYMEQFIGDEFSAVISGVTHFGLFVELNETGVEGLIPLASFSQGEFVFDVQRQQLAKGDTVLALGDPIRVKLESVDIRERKMVFGLNCARQELLPCK